MKFYQKTKIPFSHKISQFLDYMYFDTIIFDIHLNTHLVTIMTSLSPFLLLIKSLFLIRIAFVRSVDGITKIISGAGLFFCSLYYYFEHRYLSLASNGFLYVVLIFPVIFVYNPTLLKEFFRPVNQVSVEKGILVYDSHYDPSHNETAILWDFSSTMTS